jgi:orotidine-5'-phosphate decarboxylase
MNEAVRDRLIFALDVASQAQALAWARQLAGHVGMVKIGKQLFTHAGPEVVRQVQKEGLSVFLDLKYHDIPNTVAGACREAARLGVAMVNVHALGGPEMMRQAAHAVEQEFQASGHRPLLLGVTILTSSTQETLRAVGLHQPLERLVQDLACLARECGLDGVVASPQEVSALRQACGEEFVLVTPGVRPLGADVGDQKRIASPGAALSQGASYLVVGRPISQAEDPPRAADAICAEMAAALAPHG